MAELNLRSGRSRGRGAVHAPHPDYTGNERRPLCPATTKWGHGFWWDGVINEVTCRACLRLLGHTVPEPKSTVSDRPYKAIARALHSVGLKRGRDFGTNVVYERHRYGKDRIKNPSYTLVHIRTDHAAAVVLERAADILAAARADGGFGFTISAAPDRPVTRWHIMIANQSGAWGEGWEVIAT